MLNLWWTSRSKRRGRSIHVSYFGRHCNVYGSSLQWIAMCMLEVWYYVSLYGSSSQWIAMRIYPRVMPEVCYSDCLNNPHLLCLVLQWNVSIVELMNFVMCDTLRFVTQLSFHSFFIHTFKFVICEQSCILHPHRWSKSTTFNTSITSLQHTSLVKIQILHKQQPQ
jgi:hypothetical protein